MRVAGPRLVSTGFDVSSAVICHPEPAGEGSRRPSPLAPNQSLAHRPLQVSSRAQSRDLGRPDPQAPKPTPQRRGDLVSSRPVTPRSCACGLSISATGSCQASGPTSPVMLSPQATHLVRLTWQAPWQLPEAGVRSAVAAPRSRTTQTQGGAPLRVSSRAPSRDLGMTRQDASRWLYCTGCRHCYAAVGRAEISRRCSR
jgi:hypothetical protein